MAIHIYLHGPDKAFSLNIPKKKETLVSMRVSEVTNSVHVRLQKKKGRKRFTQKVPACQVPTYKLGLEYKQNMVNTGIYQNGGITM